MIRNICITLLCALALPAIGQNAGRYLVNMPDSIFPYLTMEERKELMGQKQVAPDDTARLSSQTWGEVCMVQCADDVLELNVNKELSIVVMQLPKEGTKDSVYAVATTVHGQNPMSMIRLYDGGYGLREVVRVQDEDFLVRPDTMSVERYDELTAMVELAFYDVKCGELGELILLPQIPLLANDDKKQMEPVLVRIKLKWDGERFKKVKSK